MKDKEKQIAELMKDKEFKKLVKLIDNTHPFYVETIALRVYKKYQPKLEDSVVLSREEYNDYLNLKDLLDKGYFTSENRVAIHKTRKETAEKILNSLLIEVKALDDYESVGKFDILGWLEELAKQFGVEIKE